MPETQSDVVTVTMTRRQAERLATLLNDMNGRVQYRAIKVAPGQLADDLDRTFSVWKNITRRIERALGMEYMVHDKHTTRIIDVTREKL